MSSNLADLPAVVTSSVPEWQFHIATSSGQEWQLADLPPSTDMYWSRLAIGRSTSRSPQMHHGIYIMGCIWQPFWILQEKVGISFYF